MPLQSDRNIYEAEYSLTKHKYVVEYKDKNDENAIWERCIKQHVTLDDCLREYDIMERTGFWTVRIIKIDITETPLYVNKED